MSIEIREMNVMIELVTTRKNDENSLFMELEKRIDNKIRNEINEIKRKQTHVLTDR